MPFAKPSITSEAATAGWRGAETVPRNCSLVSQNSSGGMAKGTMPVRKQRENNTSESSGKQTKQHAYRALPHRRVTLVK